MCWWGWWCGGLWERRLDTTRPRKFVPGRSYAQNAIEDGPLVVSDLVQVPLNLGVKRPAWRTRGCILASVARRVLKKVRRRMRRQSLHSGNCQNDFCLTSFRPSSARSACGSEFVCVLLGAPGIVSVCAPSETCVGAGLWDRGWLGLGSSLTMCLKLCRKRVVARGIEDDAVVKQKLASGICSLAVYNIAVLLSVVDNSVELPVHRGHI